MECSHLMLVKVANMNPTTYRCSRCGNLYDIQMAETAPPEPFFPQQPTTPAEQERPNPKE